MGRAAFREVRNAPRPAGCEVGEQAAAWRLRKEPVMQLELDEEHVTALRATLGAVPGKRRL